MYRKDADNVKNVKGDNVCALAIPRSLTGLRTFLFSLDSYCSFMPNNFQCLIKSFCKIWYWPNQNMSVSSGKDRLWECTKGELNYMLNNWAFHTNSGIDHMNLRSLSKLRVEWVWEIFLIALIAFSVKSCILMKCHLFYIGLFTTCYEFIQDCACHLVFF